MKFLCAILALLVLTLSVQPVCATISSPGNSCCSDINCEDNSGADNDNQDGCSSVCNPFQVCGCCSFSVVVPAPLVFIALSPAPVSCTVWVPISAGLPDETSSGFWQPPRLA